MNQKKTVEADILEDIREQDSEEKKYYHTKKSGGPPDLCVCIANAPTGTGDRVPEQRGLRLPARGSAV